MRNYFFIIIILAALILSGCAVNTTQEATSAPAEPQQNQELGAARQNAFENLLEASIRDLALGQSVMVMGIEDSGSSITAERILFSEDSSAFSDFGSFARNGRVARDQSQQPVSGPGSAGSVRPDFSRFQNMSDEERRQFREQMASQGKGFRAPGGATAGSARITGTIIKLDDESMAVELSDGGSRIVFFSGSTAVNKPAPRE